MWLIQPDTSRKKHSTANQIQDERNDIDESKQKVCALSQWLAS